MGWASSYIEKLQKGETVEFRPKGNSMSGLIESGDLVRVEPSGNYFVGDIVLCKVKGREYLHLIKAENNGSFLIGNNKGFNNGWTRQIYGKVVR